MDEKIIVKKPPKSPALAGFLSLIFPGTGTLYNGQILKGIIFIIVFAGLVSMQSRGSAQPFIGLLLAGFYIFQIVDSIQSAKIINRYAMRREGEDEEAEELPEALKTGSVFWGILLMVLGGIFLLANFGVISYSSIFDLWPLALILVGLKMIADYLAKDRQEE